VFCEEHHEGQLRRAGNWTPPVPPDPAGTLARACGRFLQDLRAGRTTREDCFLVMLDCFITAGRRHTPTCWGRALQALPAEAARELLACAERHRGPRGFVMTASEGVRERANREALELQPLLIERLRELLRHQGEPT
jgi:hypothetical protein